jgi:hypothetical protein
MKILEDVPFTAVEYEPALTPEERAAAMDAIQRQREERNRRDLEAGRHPIRKVFEDAARGAVVEALEHNFGRPLTEDELATLLGSSEPLRSAWEIGLQVQDRRHRAAPDGLVP